jgi:hypothetical protein
MRFFTLVCILLACLAISCLAKSDNVAFAENYNICGREFKNPNEARAGPSDTWKFLTKNQIKKSKAS